MDRAGSIGLYLIGAALGLWLFKKSQQRKEKLRIDGIWHEATKS